MAIAARAADPVLAAAAVALVLDAAQLAGPATRDRREHFAVAHRDRIAELRQIRRCVLPQGSPRPKASRSQSRCHFIAASETFLDDFRASTSAESVRCR